MLSFAVYLMIHISFGDLNSTATMFTGISCIWWLLFTEPPLRITVLDKAAEVAINSSQQVSLFNWYVFMNVMSVHIHCTGAFVHNMYSHIAMYV